MARALAAFPTLAASMAAGRICYSHARAIAGIATRGEDDLVADLLVLAEHGTIGQLEEMIAGLRSIDRELADPIDPHPARGEVLSFRDRRDAFVGLSARLAPQHATVVRAALDAVIAADTADAAGVGDDVERGPEEGGRDGAGGEVMSPAAALLAMAQLTLAVLAERGQDLPSRREDEDTTLVLHLHAVPAPASTPAPTLASGSGSGSGSGPGGAGGLVDWVLVPEAALNAARLRGTDPTAPEQDRNGSAEPSAAADPRVHDRSGSVEPPSPTATTTPSVPLARLAGHARTTAPAGAGLPGAVVERLACSCHVRVVIHGADGGVLDLGRTRRLASDKQVQALLQRQGGRCAHPGCRRRHKLHAHHVIFWQHGGLTDLDNLVLLCDYHHAAVHRGEFSIRGWGKGRFSYTRHGRALPVHVDPSQSITTITPLEDELPYWLASSPTGPRGRC